MASNGAADQAIAPVVTAYELTLQPNVTPEQKNGALQYLEQFQKSDAAWNIIFEMLKHDAISGPIQMFAATSLKGKMIHDLDQLPRNALPALRDSLFELLLKYRDGPRPVRTQLTVSLAHLAIQMTEWKDVLPVVIAKFSGKGDGATTVFLEFLKVLAEELTEGRKIHLSEDELIERSSELLTGNAEQILQILNGYASSSSSAAKDSSFISCIQSWTREIPLDRIIASPVMKTIITALDSPEAFDPAVDCLIAIIRETRDVDDTLENIKALSPIVMSLRPKLSQAAAEEDMDTFKGMARLFAETGENWVVLIAREPAAFQPLVESILEVSTRDWEKEAIGYTFRFWEDLKLWLVMDKYVHARQLYEPILSQLIDNMIKHLQYPTPEDVNELDLFEGDREAEERFRNYRHDMGHVLKDSCDVLGPEKCLAKSYELIKNWVGKYGSQVSGDFIPHWQELEAPIFAMRALGQVIPPTENVMLPQLIPILVGIPNQEKIRYQAVMTLGRYTEWTAQHPETLEDQLKFIMDAFAHPSKEVVRGATHSFQYFCADCADLLKPHFLQIKQFYIGVIDSLGDNAQQDVTEGMASILAKQPLESLYDNMKMCCDPIVQKIIQMARAATDDKSKIDIADKLQLLTIFIQKVSPYIPANQPHPAVKYCEELVPVLSALVEGFIDSSPILERVCRCWRYMILSYRMSSAPLLAVLPQKLVAGFKATRQGCFLWASDSIVREFSEHAEDADPSILSAIVPFYESLAEIFLTAMTEVTGENLPDLIEDFFRLTMDVVLHHPRSAFKSTIFDPVLLAAIHALNLLKIEVLMADLHFLRDFISYGTDNPPFSTYGDSGTPPNSPETQATVKALLSKHGKQLTERVLAGMLYTFPGDCIPDASGVFLDMMRVLPQETGAWFSGTLDQMPAGAIRQQERDRLSHGIQEKLDTNDHVKIRILLQDFTTSYRRRNVAPREGLGILEPSRFVYKGA
ncbi:ARM repeat-containing protein [Microthyrium microscopicum]|uniref:ARM repeat-containing protein n=1 Tax=Microthyrium microscopicum TaxID=703497 RepID=A0A6A6UMA6_9PEZI|nr:ARM repeat-containing protein [Microthyrium microscopicum]